MPWKMEKIRYKRLQNEDQARILYNVFNGECFFLDDQELKKFVISCAPDASGCVGEDSSGEASFKKINDIFVKEELFKKIKDLI
jgi:hypothetical protein